MKRGDCSLFTSLELRSQKIWIFRDLWRSRKKTQENGKRFGLRCFPMESKCGQKLYGEFGSQRARAQFLNPVTEIQSRQFKSRTPSKFDTRTSDSKGNREIFVTTKWRTFVNDTLPKILGVPFCFCSGSFNRIFQQKKILEIPADSRGCRSSCNPNFGFPRMRLFNPGEWWEMADLLSSMTTVCAPPPTPFASSW